MIMEAEMRLYSFSIAWSFDFVKNPKLYRIMVIIYAL